MRLFNGNARDPNAKYVPAANYLTIARMLEGLVKRGVNVDDLEVQVNKGSLQLGDETGSYGTHMWDC